MPAPHARDRLTTPAVGRRRFRWQAMGLGNSSRCGERVIGPPRSLRSTFVGDHIMRNTFKCAGKGLIPMAALLGATLLGGCVAYTGYPTATTYGYNYPGSYYGGYPSNYAYSYNYYPAYSSDYNGTFNTYQTSGDGN
jgi:hypothetical protein